MMKFAMIAAVAMCGAVPAFAKEKPVAHCDHVEMILWKLEDVYAMKRVQDGRGKWVYAERNGKKWVVESNGEEACMKPAKK